VDQPALSTGRQFGLQLREVCTAFVDNDHLAVDDRITGHVECSRNEGEALGPVQIVAGEDFLAATITVNLYMVAVVSNFANLLFASRRFRFQGLELGSNKHWHSNALRHNANPRTKMRPAAQGTNRTTGLGVFGGGLKNGELSRSFRCLRAILGQMA
jgi:hypothetical protein